MATKSKKKPYYDVFLSFRGGDTRKNFTSHLYGALVRNCLNTFHDIMLPRGEALSSRLFKAIEDSRLSLVVFSRNYANSKWCLDELVKIMNCRKMNRQTVLPVFLDVEPSDVRNQQGPYNKAFKDHESKFDQAKVQRWRRALREAGNLCGLHLQNDANGNEKELIDQIVKKIEKVLNPHALHVIDNPVGVDSRVQELISLLSLGCNDVRVVALWGVGGIGKTTTAKATYNRIAPDFESSSFLENVRDTFGQSKGPLTLQNQLISDLSRNDRTQDYYHHGKTKLKRIIKSTKVLLVLDDVDNVEQLKHLAINKEYFQRGSRIIVTTRNSACLSSLQVDDFYEPKELDESESLELFSQHAFGEDSPKEGYEELATEVVGHAAGLPLVLEIWGAHLSYFKSVQLWDCAIRKLIKIPHKDVHEKLKVSFDSLDDSEQRLFLDIACFLCGMDKDLVVKVLGDQGSGCFPDSEIEILISRCLVRISDSDQLVMHDLLRGMGREIVRRENVDEPGKRTRLWDHEEVVDVLRESLGSERVESIILHSPELHGERASIKNFRKMPRLRLVQLDHVRLSGTFDYDMLSFRKLMYMRWHGFPLKYIPSTLDMQNLVFLNLEYSKLEQIWQGMKSLNKLRFLNASHSVFLTRTPDFSGLKNLEELRLHDCTNLEELHSSIGCLDKLVVLNLKNCIRLRRIPVKSIVKLPSLEKLDLSGCPNIRYDEDSFALPSSMLQSSNIISGSNITDLMLARCKLFHVPSELRSLVAVRHLDLSENRFSSLVPWLQDLPCLEKLDVSNCVELEYIPCLPGHMLSLNATGCINLTNLPSNITELKSLTSIAFNGCSRLGSEDPHCLMKLTGLSNLQQLEMENCNISFVPDEIKNLVALGTLLLSGNSFSSLPGNLSCLENLKVLHLKNCPSLKSTPTDFPSRLMNMKASNCGSFHTMPFTSIEKVDFSHCPESLCCSYAYDFRKNILRLYQEQQEPSSISEFQVSLSGVDIPDWCNYQSMGWFLSFVAPQHVDKKVRGLILCGLISLCEEAEGYYPEVYVRNKTKGIDETFGSCGFYRTGPFFLIYAPLGNPKLVEGGDDMMVEFKIEFLHQTTGEVKKCGLSLVYEGDVMIPESNHLKIIEYKPLDEFS